MPAFQRWMKHVAAMPALKQVEAVSKKLKELNPGCEGKISSPLYESSPPVVQNCNVIELQIFIANVVDLSPLRALSGLTNLVCISRHNTGQVLDLSPLNGMKIRGLR